MYIQVRARTNAHTYSFYARVTRAWKLLPAEVTSVPTLHPFEQGLSIIYLVAPAHLTILYVYSLETVFICTNHYTPFTQLVVSPFWYLSFNFIFMHS